MFVLTLQAVDISDSEPEPEAAVPVRPPTSKNVLKQRQSHYFVDDYAHALTDQKNADTSNRFKYLLGLTDLFRHFIDERAKKDESFRKIIAEADKSRATEKTTKVPTANHRQRKTEKEEDAELLQEEDDQEAGVTKVFTESPGYVNGTLRDYQVHGLNWLISLYDNSLSGILADEMGLGKTLQTISFLGYLRYIRGVNGPHIVIVPKSTIDNWSREFARWTPEVQTLILHGDKETRGELISNKLLTCDFEVLITSYEMVLREKAHLKKFAWQYIVIDEAHRIKNEASSLSKIIRLFHSRNRLLITGTPLQNNLHELWALLNFLLPDVFSDSELFDQWFEGQGGDQDTVVKQLHKVLQPFLLRRIKSDVEKSLLPKKEINVYVGMSEMQLKWYQKILEKDIDAVNGAVSGKEKTRLLNVVMQLRKCCNHPYLFEGAEPGPPYTTDEHLVYNAGKMLILDKLLTRAKKNGSRVLIFSQMSRMLDILEDYCQFRNYFYCRIDGSTAHSDRVQAIDDYNRPGSEKFIFLLTTRAGGLGINLTTADTVVLYDSDWNPQADLQAMDRAHRIGQTKQVFVYRFVTDKAIEEKVLERAAQKLRLDQLVIQQGRAGPASSNATSKGDLLSMIQHGAQEVLKRASKGEEEAEDDDIEEILKRGEEKTQQLNSRFEHLGLDDLQKFSSDSAYEWNGTDFSKKNQEKDKDSGFKWISLAKRERKENYNIDGYYKEVLSQKSAAAANGPEKPAAPRGPKQVNIQDHQFYPQRLVDLQEKETAYFRKQINYQVPLAAGSDEDLADREAEQKMEQNEIDNAEPLTEQEEEEKKTLAQVGFSNWSRRDFYHFIQANSKHGRHNMEAISNEFEDKTFEEVATYSNLFWQRYTEIEGCEKYIAQIEAGEEKNRKLVLQKDVLKRKVEAYVAPMQQLQLQFPPSGHGRKLYTEEEDRYLLVQMNRFGLDTDGLYEKIRDTIRNSPIFKFDWFFLSRTPIELSRRGTTLITCVMKEVGQGDEASPAPTTATAAAGGASKKRKSSSRNLTPTLADDVPTSGKRQRVSTPSSRSRGASVE